MGAAAGLLPEAVRYRYRPPLPIPAAASGAGGPDRAGGAGGGRSGGRAVLPPAGSTRLHRRPARHHAGCCAEPPPALRWACVIPSREDARRDTSETYERSRNRIETEDDAAAQLNRSTPEQCRARFGGAPPS